MPVFCVLPSWLKIIPLYETIPRISWLNFLTGCAITFSTSRGRVHLVDLWLKKITTRSSISAVCSCCAQTPSHASSACMNLQMPMIGSSMAENSRAKLSMLSGSEVWHNLSRQSITAKLGNHWQLLSLWLIRGKKSVYVTPPFLRVWPILLSWVLNHGWLNHWHLWIHACRIYIKLSCFDQLTNPAYK